MFYQPALRDHGLPHDPFKALVAPRPIGWISSIDAEGRPNLAPYSFYNAVAYDPPVVVFGSTMRPRQNVRKDSHANIEATGEFVVNLATDALRDAMNASSASLPPGGDEFAHAGLATAPSRMVKPPRVAASPAALECRYLRTVELPCDAPGRVNYAVFGQVVGIHIDDSLIVDGRVDILRCRPLARLGYMDYTVVDNVFAMDRPG
ncbi:MAG: flavin reductase family protein [Alphaproteobacteria bacterium]|nr:flavin reductase family protein [Alphaproteobacteria bacterium]